MGEKRMRIVGSFFVGSTADIHNESADESRHRVDDKRFAQEECQYDEQDERACKNSCSHNRRHRQRHKLVNSHGSENQCECNENQRYYKQHCTGEKQRELFCSGEFGVFDIQSNQSAERRPDVGNIRARRAIVWSV